MLCQSVRSNEGNEDSRMTSFVITIDFELIQYSTQYINLQLLLTTLNKYLPAGLSLDFQLTWVQPFNAWCPGYTYLNERAAFS